jgi:hypothetical protein
MESSDDAILADIDRAEFMELVNKANTGDGMALAELRATLRANPAIADRMGDLAALVQRSLCSEIVKDDPSASEIIADKVQQMREELLAGTNSPIIRLAVDRAVVTWLAVSLFDVKYGDVARMATSEANLVIRQKVAAERRHQGALRTLAQVRMLVESQGASSTRRGRKKSDDNTVLNVVR